MECTLSRIPRLRKGFPPRTAARAGSGRILCAVYAATLLASFGIRLAHAADDLLDRPLFNPQRRALQQEGGSVVPDTVPHLVGIVLTARWRHAMFLSAQGGPSRAVGVGGNIQDWTVTAIDHAQVTVQRGSEQMILKPRFIAGPISSGGKP